MLEQITSFIREAAGNAVAENPSVPESEKGAVANEAVQSITGGLQKAISGGNLQELAGLFSGGAGSNTFQDILGNFVQNLTQNQGLSADKAQSLGASIFPSILEKLKGFLGNSGFDLQSVISSLSGPGGALDLNKDGKVNIEDALGLLGGKDSKGGNGGIGDMIKGLFGK